MKTSNILILILFGLHAFSSIFAQSNPLIEVEFAEA